MRISVSRSRAGALAFADRSRSSASVHGPSFGRGWTSRSYENAVSPDRRIRRTVLRDRCRVREISLIDFPLPRCSRRIRPIVSTISIPHRPLRAKAGSRTNRKSGGQFWTPMTPLRGSILHAETHPGPSMVDEEIGMPAKRELSMRQLRYLLRLHHDGVSAREIGRRLGVARSTIQDNLKRAAAAGLQWPLADDVTDEVLEQRLFGRAAIAAGQRRRVEPDWADLARELKRPGVTMMVLWEEYREGYGYSRFCDLLRGFER